LCPGDHSVTSRRARLAAGIDRALEQGNRVQKDRDRGQSQLFGFVEDDGAGVPMELPDAEPWPEATLLAYEKEALGLYLSGHPLAAHASDLKEAGARPIAELTEPAAEALVGGIVTALRLVKTKKGDRMAAFMLEDLTGTIEVVAFPEAYRTYGHLLENDRMVLVKGKVERADESGKILAAEIAPLSALQEKLAREVTIRMTAPPAGRDTFEALAEILM